MVTARGVVFARAEDEWDQELPVLVTILSGKSRFGRQHPNDRVRLAIQVNRAPDDARIGAEAPLPQPMRNDDNLVVAAGLILAGGKSAAERRAQAQYLYITCRDCQSGEAFGFAFAGKIHRCAANH